LHGKKKRTYKSIVERTPSQESGKMKREGEKKGLNAREELKAGEGEQ